MIKPIIKHGEAAFLDLGPAQRMYLTGYLDKRFKDMMVRRNRFLSEANDARNEFEKLLVALQRDFSPFLTDFDNEHILPTTTALGFWKPTHFAIEEIGYMGKFNTFTYPDEVFACVVRAYKKYYAKVNHDDVSVSIPRGKNVGWPFPVGGMNREGSDFFLALSALLVDTFQRQGASASDMFTWLRQFHGDYFTIYAERMQHTGKEIPMRLRDGWFKSTNFEARVRAVYMDPKIMVMWIKRKVNKLLKAYLMTDFHSPDKPAIAKFLKKAHSDYHVLCQDFSKFDQRHGGPRGRQMVRACAAIMDDDIYLRDLEFNDTLPLPIPTELGMFSRTDGPILTSGSGDTTLRGCTGNTFGCTYAISRAFDIPYDDVVSGLMTNFSSPLVAGRGYGDDGAICLSKKFGTRDEVKKKLQKAFEDAELSIDYEPSTKFLGFHYDKGDFAGSFDTGYPVGRFLQQQFFPERSKLYPFSTVGLVARLELVTESKRREIFELIKSKYWDVKVLGPKFNYDDRFSVVESLGPKIQASGSKISQIDDILQVFMHGLDETFDVDMPSELKALLGMTSIKYSSIDELLSKVEVGDKLLPHLKKFAKEGISYYRSLIEASSFELGLSYRPGDCVY